MSEAFISLKPVIRDKIPQFFREFGLNEINLSLSRHAGSNMLVLIYIIILYTKCYQLLYNIMISTCIQIEVF